MNAKEIDAAIRARIAELMRIMESYETATGAERIAASNEWDALVLNHLPTAAHNLTWGKVCQYAENACANPGGGADCRNGRLYELTDEEIVEAQAWLEAHPTEEEWEALSNMPGDYYPSQRKYLDAAFIR